MLGYTCLPVSGIYFNVIKWLEYFEKYGMKFDDRNDKGETMLHDTLNVDNPEEDDEAEFRMYGGHGRYHDEWRRDEDWRDREKEMRLGLFNYILGKGHKTMLNMTDNNGNTPLHRHIAAGYDETLVELMLRNGANCNIKNNNGKTPYEVFPRSPQKTPEWRNNEAEETLRYDI